MVTGWRIVPERRAESAFTGEGARFFGGRWNSPGIPVVYGSEHKSLAALEILVHLNPHNPIHYLAFKFTFPEALTETLPFNSLPHGWREEPPSPSTQLFGDQWAKSLRSAVLAVPSVIIPEEQNYVLNPAHPDFRKIKISEGERFSFDPRLLA